MGNSSKLQEDKIKRGYWIVLLKYLFLFLLIMVCTLIDNKGI